MWFEYFPFPCISQNLSCIKTDHRFITIYVKKLSFSVVPLSCADVKKKNLCNTNITLLMKQILKACPQTCGLCSVNDCNDLDSQFCTKNQASAITKISSYLCWNIAEEFAMPAVCFSSSFSSSSNSTFYHSCRLYRLFLSSVASLPIGCWQLYSYNWNSYFFFNRSTGLITPIVKIWISLELFFLS